MKTVSAVFLRQNNVSLHYFLIQNSKKNGSQTPLVLAAVSIDLISSFFFLSVNLDKLLSEVSEGFEISGISVGNTV